MIDPTYEVTNKLSGLPSAEELQALYIKFEFDRGRLSKHLGISKAQLNSMKKKLLGNCEMPSYPTYQRQFNEVQWYTTKYAEWTHIPKKECKGNSSDESIN